MSCLFRLGRYVHASTAVLSLPTRLKPMDANLSMLGRTIFKVQGERRCALSTKILKADTKSNTKPLWPKLALLTLGAAGVAITKEYLPEIKDLVNAINLTSPFSIKTHLKAERMIRLLSSRVLIYSELQKACKVDCHLLQCIMEDPAKRAMICEHPPLLRGLWYDHINDPIFYKYPELLEIITK